jgi:hypothetical protein
MGAAFGIEKLSAWTGEAISAEQAVSSAFGLTGSELQSVTAQVQKMSDVFGSDLDSSIQSTQSLMTAFGLSSQDSLKFLQTGLSKGVSADTINQIAALAPTFADAGWEAEQFMATLLAAEQKGLGDELKAGIDNASKVLEDLAKNSDAQKALKALGLNPAQINKELKAGTSSISDVSKVIAQNMQAQSDPQKVADALKHIFGDAGSATQEAVSALAQAPSSLDEIADRTTAASKAQQSLLAAWSDLKILFTASILPVFASVVSWVQENQEVIKTWGLGIAAVSAGFLAVWGAAKILMGIKGMVTTITIAWQFLSNTLKIAQVAQWAFNVAASLNPLGLVVATIAAVGGAVYGLVAYWDEISSFLVDMGSVLMNLNPLSWLIDAMKWLFPSFKEAWEDFSKHFKEYTQKAWDSFTTIFTNPFEEWVDWFQGWWSWFSGDAAPALADSTNALKNKADGINGTKSSILETLETLFSETTKTVDKRDEKEDLSKRLSAGVANFTDMAKPTSGKLGVSQALGNVAGDARQAKNITINIAKLIEQFNISSTTIGESKEKMKEAVLQSLIAAVNDVNTL